LVPGDFDCRQRPIERRLRQSRRRNGDYVRDDSLAPIGIGNPDHGHVADRRIVEHTCFDLTRIDVVPR